MSYHLFMSNVRTWIQNNGRLKCLDTGYTQMSNPTVSCHATASWFFICNVPGILILKNMFHIFRCTTLNISLHFSIAATKLWKRVPSLSPAKSVIVWKRRSNEPLMSFEFFCCVCNFNFENWTSGKMTRKYPIMWKNDEKTCPQAVREDLLAGA
jgi:hypothetical protein